MICSGITPNRSTEQNDNPKPLFLTDIPNITKLKKFEKNDKNRKINTAQIISKKIKHFAKMIKLNKKKQQKKNKENINIFTNNNFREFLYYKLKKKYDSESSAYNVKKVNELIFNIPSRLTANFKDYLLVEEDAEFLKREYKKEEFNKKFKKIFLLKKILNQHLLNIIKIQAVFKSYICRKSINNILKNNDHIFLYEFQKNLLNEIMFFSKNNDCKNTLINLDVKDLNIQMVLKEKKRDELLFNFIYNKYLKCHYTSINKIKILKKRILVNFIINNEKILDPRFEITNDKNNNNFYNVIYSKHIYKKYKDKKIVTTIKKNKYWEELFILKTRKISVDNSSISSKTDISSISRELNKNFYINNNNNSNMACDNIENKNKKNPPKGILKGIKKGNNNNKIMKKVSFKENIEVCI
jgi:hypothetical protein